MRLLFTLPENTDKEIVTVDAPVVREWWRTFFCAHHETTTFVRIKNQKTHEGVCCVNCGYILMEIDTTGTE